MNKNKKQAILVAGLGFGDEGKGTTVDYLTRIHNAHTIIRYNGGSQALHHVVTPEGTVHGFSQLGSGTFVHGTHTYLSKFMFVDPLFMCSESSNLDNLGLRNSAKRVIVDKDCVVITPFHRIINQMKETTRDVKHGSCGRGVGEAVKDWDTMKNECLLVGDLTDRPTIKRKLKYLKLLKVDLAEQLNRQDPYNVNLQIKLKEIRENYDIDRLVQRYYDLFNFGYFKIGNEQILKDLLNKNGTVIFEGAQGVLLDPRFGSPPYVTKTKTTFDNVNELLSDFDYDGQVTKTGVIRAYATRHGAGPFPTESIKLTKFVTESHNKENQWQGKFRVGYSDIASSRYAIKCLGGVDEICITNADRLVEIEPLKICTGYRSGKPVYTTLDKVRSVADILKYSRLLQEYIQARISIVSLGPTAEDKIIAYHVC